MSAEFLFVDNLSKGIYLLEAVVFIKLGLLGLVHSLERHIEVCTRHQGVGCYEDHTDAAAKESDYIPSDKAEVETEELPFVSFHHLFALVKRHLPPLRGIVLKDVGCHCVGVALDDTRDYEEKRPEKSEQSSEEREQEGLCKALLESHEHILDLDLVVALDYVHADAV